MAGKGSVAIALAPAVLIVTVPLVVGVAYSARNSAGFAALMASPFFTGGVLFSSAVALVTAALALFLGAVAAFIFTGAAGNGGGAYFAKAYVVLPYLAAASFVANTFGDSGIVAHLAKIIIPGFSSLGIRFNPLGLGVVLTCLYKQIPFVFLALSPVFAKLRARFQDTAATLGASPLRIFAGVYLPNAVRPIVGIWILVFQFTLFNYEAFAFLGPSAPKGLGELLVMLYYSANEADKALAMSLCTLEFAFSCVSGVLLALVVFWRRRSEG